MIFNSFEFLLIFLPIFFIVFFALIKFNLQKIAIWVIGIASIIFYSLENVNFLWLLILSISVNYFIGEMIIKKNKKKFFLLFGIIFNLSLLIYFKYAIFLLSSYQGIANTSFTLPDIILPIGISFYTFTQLAFLVDAYHQKSKHYTFAEYVSFVTFFPHLIAGPILIHRHFIPQLRHLKFGKPSSNKIYAGIVFFSIGMFKKVMIADSISPSVIYLFNNADILTTLEAWIAGFLYTIQLYYDFSGYSEMAVGLALFMNLKIPINFNSPYRANSIIDFWRRWHISLSYFLKQYLYIPLGGSRKGPSRQYFNLFTTMFLGGIWHGAGVTYVVWGAMHGLYLCINHYSRKIKLFVPVFFAWPLTFIAVVISWVVFRANNITDAFNIIGSMFGLRNYSLTTPNLENSEFYILLIILFIIWFKVGKNTRHFAITRKANYIISIICTVVLYLSILNFNEVSEFIYFQF
tara:strand:+ start:24764 stop:26149 length:1386 start_codon:yes stop_codon:yes gene_type:complete